MNARMPDAPVHTGVTFRQPRRQDGGALHDLVAACPPLDLNSRYAYLLLCEHHGDTSVVAEMDGRLVGAITAYIPPQQPDTLFVWQVAVASEQRGKGLGASMLQHLLRDCIERQGLRWMETTISPGNQASHKLFTSFTLRQGVGCSIATLFAASDFGASGHEEERLYKIGPWGSAA